MKKTYSVKEFFSDKKYIMSSAEIKEIIVELQKGVVKYYNINLERHGKLYVLNQELTDALPCENNNDLIEGYALNLYYNKESRYMEINTLIDSIIAKEIDKALLDKEKELNDLKEKHLLDLANIRNQIILEIKEKITKLEL